MVYHLMKKAKSYITQPPFNITNTSITANGSNSSSNVDKRPHQKLALEDMVNSVFPEEIPGSCLNFENDSEPINEDIKRLTLHQISQEELLDVIKEEARKLPDSIIIDDLTPPDQFQPQNQLAIQNQSRFDVEELPIVSSAMGAVDESVQDQENDKEMLFFNTQEVADSSFVVFYENDDFQIYDGCTLFDNTNDYSSIESEDENEELYGVSGVSGVEVDTQAIPIQTSNAHDHSSSSVQPQSPKDSLASSFQTSLDSIFSSHNENNHNESILTTPDLNKSPKTGNFIQSDKGTPTTPVFPITPTTRKFVVDRNSYESSKSDHFNSPCATGITTITSIGSANASTDKVFCTHSQSKKSLKSARSSFIDSDEGGLGRSLSSRSARDLRTYNSYTAFSSSDNLAISLSDTFSTSKFSLKRSNTYDSNGRAYNEKPRDLISALGRRNDKAKPAYVKKFELASLVNNIKSLNFFPIPTSASTSPLSPSKRVRSYEISPPSPLDHIEKDIITPQSIEANKSRLDDFKFSDFSFAFTDNINKERTRPKRDIDLKLMNPPVLYGINDARLDTTLLELNMKNYSMFEIGIANESNDGVISRHSTNHDQSLTGDDIDEPGIEIPERSSKRPTALQNYTKFGSYYNNDENNTALYHGSRHVNTNKGFNYTNGGNRTYSYYSMCTIMEEND
ncbi:hypothetical protein PACTADRAFT_31871 [Pachysolen tannophilus NRRL Y-2460]|uniref:Uncharacterized protein n=1 Tax=Pachysolen tannophilus NRRL Y-2460 TaxID=669874 RepID=A0A1E4U3B9_PACTA|nr:hypothetical protein PACTADRAFT_31871 [Pachysolen tannophilus NRRL Y-2460]